MKKEQTMIAWVLKDSVTGKFYVTAGLELGGFDEAILLRTEGSRKAGISKRKTMMRHNIKLEKFIKGFERKGIDISHKAWTKRINFGKEREKLPNFGIVAIPLNIIPWDENE